MYTKYYGLTYKPFDLIPDPGMVFLSEVHQEALAILRYGVIDRKGFLLLTGDVGTGKTTLLQKLINSLETQVHVCFIANPTLSEADFYHYLAAEYNLEDYDGNKAKFIINFASFLKNCREHNERVLLIIDEAHVLPQQLFEEIRLLSNQKYEEYGILSIFLVGQPELNDRLGTDRLLPLRQRIGIRFHLNPFSRDETADYINYRLRKAGAQRLDLFSKDALQIIHDESKGVPRLINIICDQAFLSGFAESKTQIDSETIEDTVQELHIPGEKTTLPLPANAPRNRLKKWVAFSIVCIMALIIIVAVISKNNFFIQEQNLGVMFNDIRELLIAKGALFWERYLKL
jgi:general secretion pathway protein A